MLRASQSSDLELMRLLLEHGAAPMLATDYGVTPLMVASGIGWVEGVTFEWSEEANLETVRVLLDLGAGVTMEMVYIKPGTFIMGGERTTDGRFECVEVPRHEVQLTKGFYLGKYEVTQTQWESVMKGNPSKNKGPNRPVETISTPRWPQSSQRPRW